MKILVITEQKVKKNCYFGSDLSRYDETDAHNFLQWADQISIHLTPVPHAMVRPKDESLLYHVFLFGV